MGREGTRTAKRQARPTKAQSNAPRSITAQDQSAAQDLVTLQSISGNQAVLRLLAEGSSIQRLMSVAEFKDKTRVRFSSRKSAGMKPIDTALLQYHKKLPTLGPKPEFLDDVVNVTTTWMMGPATAKTARAAGVQQLLSEAVNERTQLRGKGQSTTAGTVEKPTDKTFDDFDGKQYRLSGSPPDRVIEEVKRQTDKNGKVSYVAVARVIDFQDSKPIVRVYAQPINLGDWYPRVAHVNGMQVSPQSGIQSAADLEDDINKSLAASSNEHGLALGQEAIDVLYTYSAKRSNFVFDLFDCVKGKVSIIDTVTEKQTALMLDAINGKHRVSVSAHSRGTIKTDNAVRAVYKQLFDARFTVAIASPEVDQIRQAAIAASRQSGDAAAAGFTPEQIGEFAAGVVAKDKASRSVKADMDTYIQLIYAGNAVQYPSSVLKAQFYVSWLDPVSLVVGTYTGWGAKLASWNRQTRMSSGGGSGGHGFVKNYAKVVGESIAQDIETHGR